MFAYPPWEKDTSFSWNLKRNLAPVEMYILPGFLDDVLLFYFFFLLCSFVLLFYCSNIITFLTFCHVSLMMFFCSSDKDGRVSGVGWPSGTDIVPRFWKNKVERTRQLGCERLVLKGARTMLKGQSGRVGDGKDYNGCVSGLGCPSRTHIIPRFWGEGHNL